jgi:hypothetical protein
MTESHQNGNRHGWISGKTSQPYVSDTKINKKAKHGHQQTAISATTPPSWPLAHCLVFVQKNGISDQFLKLEKKHNFKKMFFSSLRKYPQTLRLCTEM